MAARCAGALLQLLPLALAVARVLLLLLMWLLSCSLLRLALAKIAAVGSTACQRDEWMQNRCLRQPARGMRDASTRLQHSHSALRSRVFQCETGVHLTARRVRWGARTRRAEVAKPLS